MKGTTMTRDELAKMLNGREIREEISDAEAQSAKEAGLLVIYGYSDDNVELRGIICDEIGAHNGVELLVHRNGVLSGEHECDCGFCGYKKIANQCAAVDAKWGHGGYSWWIETYLPHAPFDVMEDGEKFCRGIVIDGKDLPVIEGTK